MYVLSEAELYWLVGSMGREIFRGVNLVTTTAVMIYAAIFK